MYNIGMLFLHGAELVDPGQFIISTTDFVDQTFTDQLFQYHWVLNDGFNIGKPELVMPNKPEHLRKERLPGV